MGERGGLRGFGVVGVGGGGGADHQHILLLSTLVLSGGEPGNGVWCYGSVPWAAIGTFDAAAVLSLLCAAPRFPTGSCLKQLARSQVFPWLRRCLSGGASGVYTPLRTCCMHFCCGAGHAPDSITTNKRAEARSRRSRRRSSNVNTMNTFTFRCHPRHLQHDRFTAGAAGCLGVN